MQWLAGRRDDDQVISAKKKESGECGGEKLYEI
jgi:hypothetical protein